MFSQHFGLLVMQFTMISVVTHLSNVLRHSRRALTALIVCSWWFHLGKFSLVLHSRHAQKFEIFILKKQSKTMRSWILILVRSWCAKIAIFPIWAPFSHLTTTWARIQCGMNAQNAIITFWGVEGDVSAMWVRRDCNTSATWAQKLPCIIIPFCHENFMETSCCW